MNIQERQNEFLSQQVLPARLNVFQTAWFLGFKPHDIPVLAGAGLLKPLGNPTRNCIKHYATETLQQFRRDEKWLARASDVILNTGTTSTPASNKPTPSELCGEWLLVIVRIIRSGNVRRRQFRWNWRRL